MSDNIIEVIKEKIREKIQLEFVSLMSPELFNSIVDKEIKWFITDTGYCGKGPSPLRIIVRETLENKFKEQIKEQLNQMSSGFSGDGKPIASDVVKQMVKEIAPELWELAVQGVVQNAINNFRSSLSSY